MESPDPTIWHRSALFTVRLWQEALGEESREVRMQVKHVLSGETRYFRDWAQLVTYLMAKMQEFNNGKSVEDVSNE